MDHQAVLQHILAWAQSDHNIRASVLTGSLARDPGAADAESDLDVELYVTDPSLLLQDNTWYHQFGEVLVVEALENPDWHPTRLVYYADGKIDFMIGPATVLQGSVSISSLDSDRQGRCRQGVPARSSGAGTTANLRRVPRMRPLVLRRCHYVGQVRGRTSLGSQAARIHSARNCS